MATHIYPHVCFCLNCLIQITFGRTKIHLHRMASMGTGTILGSGARPLPWGQPSPPYSPLGSALIQPPHVWLVSLSMDDIISEPNTGHSFTWTWLISASTYTPSYLRKTPTDYHVFECFQTALLSQDDGSATAVQTPLRCTSSSWTDQELSPTRQSQAEVRACSWKRASVSRKGLSPAGCPEVEAETAPRPLDAHVCARVCVHRHTVGLQGMTLGSSWSEELLE